MTTPTTKPAPGPPWSLAPAAWGSRVPYDQWADRWTPKDKIIAHYGGGATSAGEPGATLATIEARVLTYEAWHMSPDRPDGQMRGLAYGWWIGQDGTVGRARGWNVSGAQWSSDDLDDDDLPENAEAVAVLFVLGGDQRPTGAAIAAFERLRAYLETTMGRPLRLYGHREVDPIVHPTLCPGEPLMTYVREHRDPYQPPNEAHPVRWPRLLKAGDQAPAVVVLRGLLYALGYGGRAALKSPEFDLPLANRVERFQTEHDLTVDGIVGPATRASIAAAITAALT